MTGRPQEVVGQVIEKYLSAYLADKKNPSTGRGWKTALAQRIYSENRNLFKTVEVVRSSLRWYTGDHGKTRKGGGKDSKYGKYKTDIYSKILILDIETAPLLAFCWGIWEQNINYQQIQSDWFIFTWSAKWLFEEKVYSAKLTSKEAINQDDKRIILSIWNMLNEADIVITHNGDKFDIKKLNTRFLVHNMNPPLPYISIDTLKHNKKQFSHTSNKLDYINASLGVPRKMEHEGFKMWEKCYRGDTEALKSMEKYNVQDVLILEDLYLRIRQWIKPHPNLSLHITDEKVERCPTCTSSRIKTEKKTYFTKTARYGLFRCLDCGAVGRERKTMISKERATYLKVSV
jgi:hypothetical protein